MRQIAFALALGCAIFLPVRMAMAAAELIMLEQAGCAWCVRWHKEIGSAYPKTEQGQRAPLRTVDINAPLPEDLAFVRIERFTPSFILVENGREIGRMRGYAGDEFFWYLLGEMIADLPASGN